jgi:hypothetical protein
LRGARGAPERNDIDPGAIRNILADTFILEFDPPAGFPMRIAGSRTNALFLREQRGHSFIGLWREEDQAETAGILASVADEAQPFLIGATGAPPGIEPIEIEILLLPLRHQGATHSRVLGSCALHSSPRWLGLLAIRALSLSTLRAIGPEERNGSQNDANNFSRRRTFRRHGHLFVYSANS